MEKSKPNRQGGLQNFDFDEDQFFSIDKDFDDLSLSYQKDKKSQNTVEVKNKDFAQSVMRKDSQNIVEILDMQEFPSISQNPSPNPNPHQSLQLAEKYDFEFIQDPDEDSINEFHNNHRFYEKKEKGGNIKQKLLNTVTNLGFKFFKSGDKKGLDKKDAKKLEKKRETNRNEIEKFHDSFRSELQSYRTSDITLSQKALMNPQYLQNFHGRNLISREDEGERPGISLYGVEYNENTDLFYQSFKQLIWITYRYNFRPLLIEKAFVQGRKIQHLTSDVNWGCTIRAAQMLLANVIYQSLSTQHLTVKEILDLFDDNQRGKNEHAYSIQNIAVEGLKYGKLPGEWYGVGTISNIIETLTERYEPVPSFKICVFQDGNIILEDVELRAKHLSNDLKNEVEQKHALEDIELEGDGLLVKKDTDQGNFLEAYRKNKTLTLSLKKEMFSLLDKVQIIQEESKQYPESFKEEEAASSGNGAEEEQQADESPENTELGGQKDENIMLVQKEILFGGDSQIIQDLDKWDNQVLVIVNTMLGMEKVQEEYFQSIMAFTRLPQFMGILGGKPQKAFYFIGSHFPSNQLIFMDPHKVNKHIPDLSSSRYYEENLHKFHCLESSARMIHLSKLDPCLSFAYLIKSHQDFIDFKQSLDSAMHEGPSQIFHIFKNHEEFINDLDSQAVKSFHSLSIRSSFQNHLGHNMK